MAYVSCHPKQCSPVHVPSGRVLMRHWPPPVYASRRLQSVDGSSLTTSALIRRMGGRRGAAADPADDPLGGHPGAGEEAMRLIPFVVPADAMTINLRRPGKGCKAARQPFRQV